MKTLGPLLPRDFLERQPERWKRSQRKRGALKVLKRMQAKREKLEEKTMRNVRNDAAVGAQPKLAKKSSPPQAPKDAMAVVARKSSSTGFGPLARGFWGAHLMPNEPLVVSIPEGAHLRLFHAALSSDVPLSESSVFAITAVRCRTPATKIPTTLCYLQHALPDPNVSASHVLTNHLDSAQLQLVFTQARDGRCAIAAEGPHSVHLLGMYSRDRNVHFDAMAEGKAAVASEPKGSLPEGAAILPTNVRGKSESNANSKPVGHGKQEAEIHQVGDGLKVVDTVLGRGRSARRGNKLSVRYTGLTTDAQGKWFQVRCTVRHRSCSV